ncbi:cell division septal protein FtsQ [Roseobacter sp. N2S]|nr:cell division septal protein FtsQ [Roseobacter sp. N2S]
MVNKPVRQLAWFVALWLLGVAVLGVVAYAIRLAIY